MDEEAESSERKALAGGEPPKEGEAAAGSSIAAAEGGDAAAEVKKEAWAVEGEGEHFAALPPPIRRNRVGEREWEEGEESSSGEDDEEAEGRRQYTQSPSFHKRREPNRPG